MTQAEQIAMNVWNEIIARPRNQRKGISYAQLEKVVQDALNQAQKLTIDKRK